MKNDNLNITFSIECYNISILKFSHERLRAEHARARAQLQQL